ncbi:FAD-dependent oxidoreductase [Hyphomicrobium sp.]|uniref:FAD-dependent oxidoreductase n=1 Tax=Hyphomicrobium sp. TaxID=82 RepID=UPI003F7130EA
MSSQNGAPSGPDLTLGVAVTDLVDGKLVGHVGEQDVLVVHVDGAVYAVDAHCTHYQAPLGDGLVVGAQIRCPWHHACFDVRTGEAVHAPAFSPLSCWIVDQRDGRIVVKDKHERAPQIRQVATDTPARIVIIGGGAAGFAAAEMLRRRGFAGSIVMLSDDTAPPVDRPNLSKDYLAGSAEEDWLPLRPDNFYADARIDLRLGAKVTGLRTGTREVVLAEGAAVPYDRLLLTTGAEPVRLTIPGADLPHVHTLRSLSDCRAIIEHAKTAKRVVVVGASFIGLEVAASLRARGLEVHVVAPDKIPMQKILGSEIGRLVRDIHEQHGVIFHLEDTAVEFDAGGAMLKSGVKLQADVIVAGVGVRPRLSLAEGGGLVVDRGVLVNAYLETSIAGIFAAGDIARWPDPHTGQNIRVEHWVVAERQGQTAALNMLGERQAFDAVPFFWSQHYDMQINYVGHAEHWDELSVDGDIGAKDCIVRYRSNGRTLAVASINRDLECLKAELALERADRSYATVAS